MCLQAHSMTVIHGDFCACGSALNTRAQRGLRTIFRTALTTFGRLPCAACTMQRWLAGCAALLCSHRAGQQHCQACRLSVLGGLSMR